MDQSLFFDYNKTFPIPDPFKQTDNDPFSFISQEDNGHNFLKDNRDHFTKLFDDFPSRAGVQRNTTNNPSLTPALMLYDDYYNPTSGNAKNTSATCSRDYKTSNFEVFLDFNTGLKRTKLFPEEKGGFNTKLIQKGENFSFNELFPKNQADQSPEQHQATPPLKKNPYESENFAKIDDHQGAHSLPKANIKQTQQTPQNHIPFFTVNKEKELVAGKGQQALTSQSQNIMNQAGSQFNEKEVKNVNKKGYQKAASQELGSHHHHNHHHHQSQKHKAEKGEIEAKADALIKAIEKYEINPISLLNEINGKLKKKADYQLKEFCTGRTKTFECLCLLNEQPIGVKKGNSKQHAKAEAAKDGIYTILTNEQYVTESAVIILSIQKASGKTAHSNFRRTPSETNFDDSTMTSSGTFSKKSSLQTVHEEDHHHAHDDQNHNSVIFAELQEAAKNLGIEPIWSFPHQTIDGDFEVELKLGDIEVKEKRKKKQEAKREAATKMLQKIKELQEEEERNAKNNTQVELPIKKHKNRMMKFFKKSLKPELLERVSKAAKGFSFGDLAQENSNKEFENKITSLYNYRNPGLTLSENLQDFFKKITDYTSMTTSNPKQVMLNAERHLADYIRECYLIPTGSFALKCMRNNNLTIDAFLSFQEVREISKQELLELYRYSLETCYSLDQQSGTNIIDMRFSFQVAESFIEVIETFKTKGNLRIHIYLSNVVSDSRKINPISEMNRQYSQAFHVEKIYNSFQTPEELNEVRKLLSIIRTWRRNAKVEAVRPEILDMILLDVYRRNPSCQASEIITKFFMLLSSQELIPTILQSVGGLYSTLYQELSSVNREDFLSKCRQTLASIHQKRFSDAYML